MTPQIPPTVRPGDRAKDDILSLGRYQQGDRVWLYEARHAQWLPGRVIIDAADNERYSMRQYLTVGSVATLHEDGEEFQLWAAFDYGEDEISRLILVSDDPDWQPFASPPPVEEVVQWRSQRYGVGDPVWVESYPERQKVWRPAVIIDQQRGGWQLLRFLDDGSVGRTHGYSMLLPVAGWPADDAAAPPSLALDWREVRAKVMKRLFDD